MTVGLPVAIIGWGTYDTWGWPGLWVMGFMVWFVVWAAMAKDREDAVQRNRERREQ